MPDPLARYPQPLLEERLVWHVCPPAGVFEGTVYVDGSGLRGRCPVRRRCGFSAVILGEGGIILGCLFGALPGPLQTVPGAELLALLVVLRHAGVHLDIASDCAYVVDGINDPGARAKNTAGTSVHAALWLRVWDCIDDIGSHSISVRKVKAHSSLEDVTMGLITARDRRGNQAADHYAKLGARLHPHDSAVDRRAVKAAWSLRAAGQWVAQLGVLLGSKQCGRDSEPLHPAQRRVAQRAERRKQRRAPEHQLVAVAGGFCCSVCHKKRVTRAAFSRRCAPPERQLVWHPHCLARAGPVRWCVKCGCYADRVVRGLRRSCRILPTEAGGRRLAALTAGVHPRTRERLEGVLPLLRSVDIGAPVTRCGIKRPLLSFFSLGQPVV